MSRFGRLFRSKKPVEEMSLVEIAAFIRSNQDDMPARGLIQVSERLTEIAFFDHETTNDERLLALELIPAVDTDIETGLADNPEALQSYREAVEFHRGAIRHSGYGSLHWIMEENQVEAGEVIPFIAASEYAQLLPAYLEMMEPAIILQIRSALLQQLAASRATPDERPLATLNRLANSGDGSLTLLLDGRQLGAISRAHRDPATGEAVLVELGVSG